MTYSACGIDFGTSNSTAGIVRPAGAILLALEEQKLTLPSAVFFNLEEERWAYGRAALAEYLEGYEGRLMRSMKSLLGSSLMDAGTEIGGRHLSFKNLIGQLIGEVKTRAEQSAGQQFDAVVLGRPVRFVDDNDAADAEAEATLADIAHGLGFKEVSFQFEPIAAAHDYEQRIEREELVLVVDIGGGTSDFSLVRLSPERRGIADRTSDLLASGGVHIGGTDFDKRLSLACVMPELGLGSRLSNNAELPNSAFFHLATWHTINFAYTRKMWRSFQDISPEVVDNVRFERLLNVIRSQAGHHLAMRVEEAKIALSEQDHFALDLVEAEKGLVAQIERRQFEQAIEQETARICASAQTTLTQAGIAASQVDTLFFTGGSSAVPALRAALAAQFPAARAVEGDHFGSVGCGLSVVAQQRYG
ncbi:MULTISPECIES: Hsp70 family protein [Deefgea]|uniref:Hsp70 family protein n=1 Tax=Deefgea chitinilytica TaxID=570276 RepID=A0ABS2CC03_9NEIS|nr:MULTISPECIES: Hsp70 family protein [Deefgea]MBM5571674.1 Hsp70 family protein [Deefgea chitinilytica]MBM9888909.1 Hsp70 family protein [Deefgea sp. CFH1-16]